MGINKYNCEGYYDPTPNEALTRIENEARKLHTFRPVVYIRKEKNTNQEAES